MGMFLGSETLIPCSAIVATGFGQGPSESQRKREGAGRLSFLKLRGQT